MPANRSSRQRIIFAFACVYLCWGSTYGAIHIAALHIAPPLVGAMRSFFSTIVFTILCVSRGVSLRVPRRTAWQLALVGILFMSVNNVLLIWAETKVASGYAALVIAMIPILVALLETALPGGETLNLRGWLGTLLAALGMVALLWPSLHHAAGAAPSAAAKASAARTLAGFAILVLAALSFAVGSVLSRRFHFQVDTFVATAWQIAAAGLVNLALAAATGSFHTARFTLPGVLATLYLSVVGSVIGLTAYTYLLQHVAVTKVSTYAFVNPVIALLLGAIAFHERLTPAEILGSLLILLAVATVILSRTKPGATAATKPAVAE